jgi:hypothetical protein
MDVLIRTTKLILLIKIFAFQRFGKKYRTCGCKKRTLFDVFNRVVALQMKVCHSGMSK